MKKRLLSAALACLLLSGCGTTAEPPELPETAEEERVIAYVPLDDRPDNVERVAYLAESLGYTLEMPGLDLYRTRLDHQPLNENGTQYGDRAALYEWVLEQEAAGCDRYILSLDQLLSGGLVNSRAMFNHEDVVFWDEATGTRTTWTEYELLGYLLTALTADGNNQVWLLDSVMRLAPTVGYQGGTLEEYNALRAFGAEPRPELTGEALTLGNVEETYWLDASGNALFFEEYGLAAAQVVEYLSARGRKLELTDALMEMVTGIQADNVHVLIGIDDSSEENSIQKNEIAYLRSLLREGDGGQALDTVLSGVDDLAFKAVAKLYLAECGWEGAAVSVAYFGGTEDQPACAYDYQPLTEIVAEHLDFFGLTAVSQEDAELLVLVLTQPADETKKTAYYEALIDTLSDAGEAGMPTILIDAGNGRYGTAFHDALTKKTELGRLLSYAGFLDMAIVTGTALSHGVARYAFLQSGQPTAAAETAFARTLADSIIKDFCYKNVVREDLLAYIRNDLGGSPDNFWDPDIDREAILARLESGMDAAAADVVKNLERSSYILSLDQSAENGGLAGWGGVELSNYRFPWDRAFEIGMDIQVGEPTAPHKSFWGIWYQ